MARLPVGAAMYVGDRGRSEGCSVGAVGVEMGGVVPWLPRFSYSMVVLYCFYSTHRAVMMPHT